MDVVVTTLKCIFTTSILVELLTNTFLKLVKLSTKKTLIFFFFFCSVQVFTSKELADLDVTITPKSNFSEVRSISPEF